MGTASKSDTTSIYYTLFMAFYVMKYLQNPVIIYSSIYIWFSSLINYSNEKEISY